MDICSKKNQINDILQDIFAEYNRMNETKIQSKCESDLEMRNMITTIRDLEKSETDKIKVNQELEDEVRSLKRQKCEYESMINDLQRKLEIADEEEQENNKFDMLRIQAKEITMKDREIDRLNKLIKNLKSKNDGDDKEKDKIDSLLEKVTFKEGNLVKIIESGSRSEPEPEPEPEPDKLTCEPDKLTCEPDKLTCETEELDRGNLLKITYKKVKYHVYSNENPQYVYEFNDDKKADKILGIRTKNEKGKYKIQLN